jgi:hypothetical protein
MHYTTASAFSGAGIDRFEAVARPVPSWEIREKMTAILVDRH